MLAANNVGEVFQLIPKENKIKITTRKGPLTVKLAQDAILKKYQEVSKKYALAQSGKPVRVKGILTNVLIRMAYGDIE